MTERKFDLIAEAKIKWTGRVPPPGPKYSTVADFPDEQKDYGAWSMVLHKRVAFGDSMWVAAIRWLAPDAPSGLIRPGATFVLREGSKPVAEGVVTSMATGLGT